MVYVKCLLMFCVVICFNGQVHDLNIRKCRSIVDESYKVVELQCLYEGEGSYIFHGPTSVKKITLDRLAGSSTLMTFGLHLEKVLIKTCTIDNCCLAISTTPNTEVQIADKVCSLEDLVPTMEIGTSPHTEVGSLGSVPEQTRSVPASSTYEHNPLSSTVPGHQQTTTENETATNTTPWIVATVTTLTELFQVLIFTLISLLVVLNRIHRFLINAAPAIRNFIPPVRQLLNPPPHQPLHQAAVQPIPPAVHQEIILPLPAPPRILRRSTRQSIPPNRLNLKFIYVINLYIFSFSMIEISVCQTAI